MKYKLKKDWIKSSGKVFPKGTVLEVGPKFILMVEGKTKKKKDSSTETNNKEE